MKKRLIKALVRQFGHPTGLLGHVVGWVLARRPSNVARSRWAIDLLDLKPTDGLLEVGCGPGVALAAAAARAGTVVGVDASAVMVRHARRRAKVEVHHASAESLPHFDEPFDKALAVNTVGHWPDKIGGLRAIGKALRPGATIAVVSQPRLPGATAADSQRAAEELQQLLADAGYVDARVETFTELEPPAVCVLARSGG